MISCLFVSLLLITPFKARKAPPVPSLLILHRRLTKLVLRGMYWVRRLNELGLGHCIVIDS